MSDIQLFRYGKNGVSELPGKSAAIEKDLQKLIESHMEAFLGPLRRLSGVGWRIAKAAKLCCCAPRSAWRSLCC